MKHFEPPRFAVWLLQRFGDRHGTLAGDLVEQYRCGRSNSWFWRQSIASILVHQSSMLLADKRLLIVGWMQWLVLGLYWEAAARTFAGLPIFASDVLAPPLVFFCLLLSAKKITSWYDQAGLKTLGFSHLVLFLVSRGVLALTFGDLSSLAQWTAVGMIVALGPLLTLLLYRAGLLYESRQAAPFRV